MQDGAISSGYWSGMNLETSYLLGRMVRRNLGAFAEPTGFLQTAAAARRQSGAPPEAAELVARREANRPLASAACVCADRRNAPQAPSLGAALEYSKRCARLDRFPGREDRIFQSAGQWVVVSVGSPSGSLDSNDFTITLSGIRVSISASHNTSNQYTPVFGVCSWNAITRLTPCSPPRNSTGQRRSGCRGSVASGVFRRTPISCSPTTSPDLSEMKIVRLMAIVSPGASGETFNVYESTTRMRLGTLSASRRTLSQTQAAWTRGFAAATTGTYYRFLRHLVRMAMRAMADRLAGESAAARAFPPWMPPASTARRRPGCGDLAALATPEGACPGAS